MSGVWKVISSGVTTINVSRPVRGSAFVHGFRTRVSALTQSSSHWREMPSEGFS
jgi:hypothetical protein